MKRSASRPVEGSDPPRRHRLKPFDRYLCGRLRELYPAHRSQPLPTLFVLAYSILTMLSVWLLVTNKYLPGQDVAYHAHAARVWLNGATPGGPYANYEPRHVLEANTLMYSASALLSSVMSPFGAFRIAQGYYLLGLPAACLYALRSLERPPWGSLLAFPLCYGEVWAAGYANMSFAAPTFIVALVTYHRFVRSPSMRRGIATSAIFAAVFLSHAQAFLWLGALVASYSIGVLVVRLGRALAFGSRGDLADLGSLTVGALGSAAPSILLFARWYAKTYGAGQAVGTTGANVPFRTALEYLPLVQKVANGSLQAFDCTTHPSEPAYLVTLGLIVALAFTLARIGADRSSPVFELAVLSSILSYYLLPDAIAGQMVAVRQWYFVYWMLPVVVVPTGISVSRMRAGIVIALIFVWIFARMALIVRNVGRFSKEEMAGFDQVVAAAPNHPGLTVAYASTNPRSAFFQTSPHFHSYGFLSAQQEYDGPLEHSTRHSVAAIRYTSGPPLPVRHLYNNQGWAADPIVWSYDLVLVHRWHPNAAQLAIAEQHGSLIASAGEWQLWRSRH